MCGEQIVKYAGDFASMGSSPRVRGTVDNKVLVPHHVGIIPACAGNSKIDIL